MGKKGSLFWRPFRLRFRERICVRVFPNSLDLCRGVLREKTNMKRRRRRRRGGFLLGGVFFNSQYHTFSSNEEHHG